VNAWPVAWLFHAEDWEKRAVHIIQFHRLPLAHNSDRLQILFYHIHLTWEIRRTVMHIFIDIVYKIPSNWFVVSRSKAEVGSSHKRSWDSFASARAMPTRSSALLKAAPDIIVGFIRQSHYFQQIRDSFRLFPLCFCRIFSWEGKHFFINCFSVYQGYNAEKSCDFLPCFS